MTYEELKQDVGGLKVSNVIFVLAIIIKFMQVVDIPKKGKGVITTRSYREGEFICEYEGDLLSHKDALKREQEYLKHCGETYKGYMYYFSFKNKKYW